MYIKKPYKLNLIIFFVIAAFALIFPYKSWGDLEDTKSKKNRNPIELLYSIQKAAKNGSIEQLEGYVLPMDVKHPDFITNTELFFLEAYPAGTPSNRTEAKKQVSSIFLNTVSYLIDNVDLFKTIPEDYTESLLKSIVIGFLDGKHIQIIKNILINNNDDIVAFRRDSSTVFIKVKEEYKVLYWSPGLLERENKAQ